MTTLTELGAALYGRSQWRAEMARDLNMSLSHFNRLVSGRSPILPAVALRICALAEARRDTVCEVVEETLGEGVTA